ncbi:MAG: helix-turn-helix domain containing protein [Candidatus Izemoplasmatales bacterium]|nr:helix-turn-helix domain containing protein [Candidatus Izemoplasmatales bacterium]
MAQNLIRPPKTKVGEKTFQRIIKTGKRLFARHGYQATSINDIIAKSKVAAGTFYIYFDNKLALYLYLLKEYRHAIRQASSEATRGLKSREEIERAGLKAFIMYVKKEPLAYKVIWESLFIDPKIFQEYYQSFGDSYIFHLRHFVESGEIRNDIDLETLAYILMGISNFVGLQILFREEANETDVDYVVDETMKLLRTGMFAKK